MRFNILKPTSSCIDNNIRINRDKIQSTLLLLLLLYLNQKI